VATVSAVLEGVAQVLETVGFERMTTTRVAERAGTSVGTLYQYFPSKEALLVAVVELLLDSGRGEEPTPADASRRAGRPNRA
jgi:AcrR family transcriptional regulator